MFSHIIHVFSSSRIENTAELKQECLLCKGNTALALALSQHCFWRWERAVKDHWSVKLLAELEGASWFIRYAIGKKKGKNTLNKGERAKDLELGLWGGFSRLDIHVCQWNLRLTTDLDQQKSKQEWLTALKEV